MARHLYVPDTQVRPGVPTDHIDWVAQTIVEYKPDTVIVGGDWWDFPSLNSHSLPGSKALENTRYDADIHVGNEAFKRLVRPMNDEIRRQKKNKRKKPWNPRKIFTTGNHEDRADRVASNDPKWTGVIGSDSCDIQDFERFPFLARAWQDGICYSHFFQSPHSHRPIGGSALNRIGKIGASFVMGHQQGFDYGTKVMGSGKTLHGLIAGSCYVHIEDYRGNQGQQHWRGIVVLNEVTDGDYNIMPVTLNYLCRKNTGLTLQRYHEAKYPNQNWEHLAA